MLLIYCLVVVVVVRFLFCFVAVCLLNLSGLKQLMYLILLLWPTDQLTDRVEEQVETTTILCCYGITTECERPRDRHLAESFQRLTKLTF